MLLVGPVFQVNSYTTGDQFNPEVCRGNDGRFVVTWSGGTNGVFARRFDAGGSSLGSEMGLGAGGAGNVACDAEGGFVAVKIAPDGAGNGVFARRYTSSGSLVGSEFLVNMQTAGSQDDPDVCVEQGGDFVVAWTSPDGSGDGVFTRRFSSSGTTMGTDFQLNVTTMSDQNQPAVGCRSSGEVVGAWADSGAGGIGRRITLRRVSSGTGNESNETFFSPFSDTTYIQPDLAVDAAGDAVVAWQADRQIAGTNDPNRTVATLVTSDGTTVGSQIDVTRGGFAAQAPAIASAPNGDFMMAWQEQNIGVCQGFCVTGCPPAFPFCRDSKCCTTSAIGPQQIVAQRFSSSGGTLGANLEVSGNAQTAQTQPAVAGDGSGSFVVAWRGEGLDGDSGGIFARRYTHHVSQAVGSLSPCVGTADRWEFDAAQGRDVTVRADTLDPETAADLCLSVECGGLSVFGDDEEDCSFPPSSFSCPVTTFVAPVSDRCLLTVSSCSAICGDPQRANYSLVVSSEGSALALAAVDQEIPTTPSGTPKRTNTPTPTPTHRPSERVNLDIAVYRSLDDRLYVLISSVLERRIRITSLAVAPDDVVTFAEQFLPGALLPDLVLTAFAGADTLLPPNLIRSTGVLRGLSDHPDVESPVFDPCAIAGSGLLDLPGEEQVAAVGTGPYAPHASELTPLSLRGEDRPPAIQKRVTRRVAGSTVVRQTTVFPEPGPAQCRNDVQAGTPCTNDNACDLDCEQVGQGCCARASRPPVCSADERTICDPAEASSCFFLGSCTVLGGEVDSQTVTFDDTLDTPLGNPSGPDSPVDGILLDGRCDDPEHCQAIVLVLELEPLVTDAIQVAAAGFVIDDSDHVIGTASGIGADGGSVYPGSVISCDQPAEYLANTDTSGSQGGSALCHTPTGDLIAVWGGDGVRGQRFASGGLALGTEFQINTFAGDGAGSPTICCSPADGFVVAWSSGRDGDYTGVFAQRFGSGGTRLGTEFQVNTYTEQGQGGAQIACGESGDFAIVWTSGPLSGPFGPAGQDGSASGIFGQRFTSSGQRSGTELQVNGEAYDVQAFPTICGAAGGDYVVGWISRNGGTFRFDAALAVGLQPLSGAPLNSAFALHQFAPSVGCAPNGNFLLAVEGLGPMSFPGQPPSGADGDGRGILARRFSSSGSVLGSEFVVNTVTGGDQTSPRVAPSGDEEFLIVWEGSNLKAQRYAGDGSRDGAEFAVNTRNSGEVFAPAVSCGPSGECAVSWTGPDGDDTGVYLRQLPAP